MTLRELLAHKKSVLCERWLDAIFAEYGEETAAKWRSERDRFANPVGHAFAVEVPRLYEAVSGDGDLGSASAALEAIIRIRSIQEFTPSRAVGFVYLLRDVVRGELGGQAPAEELVGLERRIESLALLAFDVYVRCRDQVFRLRHDELKRSVAVLLRRWNGGELPRPAPKAASSSLPILPLAGDR